MGWSGGVIDEIYHLSVTPMELGRNADGVMRVKGEIQLGRRMLPGVVSIEGVVVVAAPLLVCCEA